jgi:hypothetical protein
MMLVTVLHRDSDVPPRVACTRTVCRQDFPPLSARAAGLGCTKSQWRRE